MIRLFSPFDLFYFFKNWIRLFLIVFIIIIRNYLLTLNKIVYNFIFINLSRFFFSLKIKSFNKNSNLFFIRLFFFLVYINFFSVYSYNFPLSSQVRVIIFFSFSLWLINIIFRVFNFFGKFFSHLIPEGTPMVLTFLLFLIELIRNFIRPITLIVRLVANILAGHLLIILLSQLVFNFFMTYPFYILLSGVEIFVSLIQSYIFTTILVLYYSEV